MSGLVLLRPEALWLLLLVPLALLARRRRGARPAALAHPRLPDAPAPGEWRRRALAAAPLTLRLIAAVCLVLALAEPRLAAGGETRRTDGISIVVALDLSSSMLALDLGPSGRLGAAIRTTARFVDQRPGDAIGLVTFAGETLTRVPITLDHQVLREALATLRWGELEDGTAIGDGLAVALSRLRESSSRSRVVVLMSDGSNTAGAVAPLDAARAARELGVRVYTIGIGSRGEALAPVAVRGGRFVYRRVPVRIDERLLSGIARATGGRYYRASDTAALADIYRQIDRLERSPSVLTRRVRYVSLAPAALAAAALLILLELALRASRWGVLP